MTEVAIHIMNDKKQRDMRNVPSNILPPTKSYLLKFLEYLSKVQLSGAKYLIRQVLGMS